MGLIRRKIIVKIPSVVLYKLIKDLNEGDWFEIYCKGLVKSYWEAGAPKDKLLKDIPNKLICYGSSVKGYTQRTTYDLSSIQNSSEVTISMETNKPISTLDELAMINIITTLFAFETGYETNKNNESNK